MRFVAIALILGCGSTSVPAPAAGLQGTLERAADLEGVPRPLLIAMAYVDSRLSMREGQASVDGAYGLLHLVDRPDAPAALSLQRAARLTGLDPASLRTDPFANARGGAALLRDQADVLFAQYPALDPSALGDWYAAVMKLSGSADAFIADGYAAQVYRVLRDGLDATGDGERVQLSAQAFELAGRAIGGHLDQSLSGEYCPGGACVAFVPAASTNFAPGRGGNPVNLIVIHDMEGTYSSSIAWFQNPASQVSAHYDVRSSDGQITQQVLDADTAWHSGNHDVNQHAIGIEHEGYAAQGAQWYTLAMYQSSAALARWLCETNSIPEDRQHIIGHYEVPNLNHPGWYGGANAHHDPCDVWAGDPTWHNVTSCAWDWNQYMSLITSGGAATPPATAITSPAAGATVSGLVQITATSTGATKVEIYVDGGLLATGTAAQFTAAWDTTQSSSGAHQLIATAYAADGRAGSSPAVAVTVSNAAPPSPAPCPSGTIQAGNSCVPAGGCGSLGGGNAGWLAVAALCVGLRRRRENGNPARSTC